MIVYTGNETKLGMNKSTPAEKWTKLDQFIDRVTIFVFIYQVCPSHLFSFFFFCLAHPCCWWVVVVVVCELPWCWF